MCGIISCLYSHFDNVRYCWLDTYIYICIYISCTCICLSSYCVSFLSCRKNKTRDETESLNKSRLRERNNTQSFVNDGKEKGKVAIVSPFVGSSVKSEGDTQKENTNAEIQQEIEYISGQTVDNAQNFGTNNQKWVMTES